MDDMVLKDEHEKSKKHLPPHCKLAEHSAQDSSSRRMSAKSADLTYPSRAKCPSPATYQKQVEDNAA